MLRTSRLEPACGSTPQGVVDLVHNIRCADPAVVEAATVETLKSLFAAADRVELDKDLALTVGIDSDVNYLAIFFFTLSLDFDLKLFNPVVANHALFPGKR